MRSILILITLGLAIVPAWARADADTERAYLARWIHELTAIAPLLEAAERHANPDARIRFQYEWLRQDLDRIRMGVAEHLQAVRQEPRRVEPLRGDYRR